jgi:microcystin-dependent protein
MALDRNNPDFFAEFAEVERRLSVMERSQPTLAAGSGVVNFRGAYNPATAYVVDDSVSYNGSSYVCVLATTGNLPTNTTYWQVLAAKGDTGNTGATGAVGLIWRAAYNGATAYVVNDAVYYNGTAYICILASTGHLPTDNTYWQILASKGDQGNTGATGNTGAKGAQWRGAWSGATAYVVDDIVQDGGSAYICILNHTNHQPPNGTYWQLVASKGDTGNTGATGAKGMQWKAAWSGATAYVVDDAVYYGGQSYIAILNGTNKQPDTNPTYWSLMAQKGADSPTVQYEVGDIYITTAATDPNTRFAGTTWVRFGAGRVLVGYDSTQTEFDTVEETGGAKTHTLSSAEIPSHYHSVDPPATASGTESADHVHYDAGHSHAENSETWINASGSSNKFFSNGSSWWHNTQSVGGRGVVYVGTGYASLGGRSAAHTHTTDIAAFNSGTAGSGGAHNNLQPYIVVYMWKRTA